MQQAQAFLRKPLAESYMKGYISSPCGLLVGPQEDFHILMDVLHLF